MAASFERFCLAAGLETLGAMLESDAAALCGPRHAPGRGRRGHRWGRTTGKLGFHGGKVEIGRPRVRGLDGRGAGAAELGAGDRGGLARPLGDEPDADQRLDAPVRPGGAAARG